MTARAKPAQRPGGPLSRLTHDEAILAEQLEAVPPERLALVLDVLREARRLAVPVVDVDLTLGDIAAGRLPAPSALGRPVELAGGWGSLAAACGGVGALADALGVDVRSVRRWASGERKPAPRHEQAVRVLAATRGLPAPV